MVTWTSNLPSNTRSGLPTSVSGRDLVPCTLPTCRQAYTSRRHRRAFQPCQATLVGPGTRRAAPLPGDNSDSPESSSLLILPQQKGGKATEEAAMRASIATHMRYPDGLPIQAQYNQEALEEAYTRCGIITADYAKTFYLGTKLMTPEKAKAIWSIYVWCRRTDELVDGPNASRITPAALDSWEHRLESLFEGRPYDAMDAALTDTIAQFPVSIQPFKDMIDGMRMDLTKARYANFDELYDYCYKVAGTVGLMTTPVMGVDPTYKGPLEAVYRAALALGTANQLTNILRDVGEDASQRNRIYVPMDELEQFGIRESEILNGNMFSPHSGKIDDKWQRFMKYQISRARAYFADAEAGVDFLDSDARWPVWSALILYRQILDAIEANNYNNFTQRAYVKKWRKYGSLPLALVRAKLPVELLKHTREAAARQKQTMMPSRPTFKQEA